MSFWFIYFQFYWFPSLRKHWFNWACGGLAFGFSGVNYTAMRLNWPGLSLLAVILVLGGEWAWVQYKQGLHYFPAFWAIAILDYILSAFVNSVSTITTLLLTSFHFIQTTWGITTILTFNSVFFAMIAVGALGTQAPMENFIQSVMTRKTQYRLLLFMILMLGVFLFFVYSLRVLDRSVMYLFFMMGMTGVVMVSLTFSIYLLIQTHLQQEHARLQTQQQTYHAQYSAEMQRQAGVVRKFRHDYQNILLGFGGYLHAHDYAGFKQYYIDVRSRWQTSDAADLTIDDLSNMPQGIVQYGLYHDYLLAQRLGVNLFIDIPKPLTATVAVGRQVGKILGRALPVTLQTVATIQPALVNLKITESVQQTWVEITFPVPTNARIVQGNQVEAGSFHLDFSTVLKDLPSAITIQLTTKLHWARLLVTLPMT